MQGTDKNAYSPINQGGGGEKPEQPIKSQES